jgi:Predicted membrane protein (DUF2085)
MRATPARCRPAGCEDIGGKCTIRGGMLWRLSFLRRAFVGAAVAWFSALPLATLVASEPHPPSAVYLLSFFVYLAGSVLCHQLPARSWFLWGSQMPVCARCTGIYAGAAVSALVAVASAARLEPSRSKGFPPPLARVEGELRRGTPKRLRREGGALHTARSALVVAVVPTAATLVYEWTTGQAPANWIRAAAGVPIGVVVAWIVCALRPAAVEG